MPEARATEGTPIRAEKAASKASRLGPTELNQLLAKASATYPASAPPICGTDKYNRFMTTAR